ncbi:hypothetical protein C8R43DRAFT_1142538 [Mycena crocata]|nr:hypothetical protein C8R43DRAFT_1142538 [Mycena crocata]
MSTFQNSKSGLPWTLGPKAPSGVLMRGASPGGFSKTAESSLTYESIGTVAQAGAGVFPVLRTTAEVTQIEVGSHWLTSGVILSGEDSVRAGCGAGGHPLPPDDGARYARAVVFPDIGSRSVTQASVLANARETIDEGPAQRAEFWAAAPTTASGASLALSLATGSAGSLPEVSRTPPIPIGVVLAQPRQGAWVFWLHAALLLACAAGLLTSNWRPTLFREHTMSLAGARLFPGMSCSCAVPFSDRVYRLATCSDSPHLRLAAPHAMALDAVAQAQVEAEDGRVVTEAMFHAREPYRVP